MKATAQKPQLLHSTNDTLDDSALTFDQLKSIRKASEKNKRPFIALSDKELDERLSNNAHVVKECIQFANKIAKGEHDSWQPLDGLYFAFKEYQELSDELSTRLYELKRNVDAPDVRS